ncbi:hypothetical protein Tco_0959225, partial [Tanacetum coccineum]
FALIEFPTGIIDSIVLLIRMLFGAVKRPYHLVSRAMIASLKQRIQELKRRQEKTRSKRARETLNKENPFSYVCDRRNHRGGVQKKPYVARIQVEITGEFGKGPFKNNLVPYESLDEVSSTYFKEEPIVLVEEKSCPVYDTDNKKEESMPVYDTDIDDVIEDEEGFVRKEGFGGEEDNIEDIVVMANDICSSMNQTTLSVDVEEDVNTKSHELMGLEKILLSR